MEQTCHRCNTTVSREDAFCPNCGAAQLRFDTSEALAFDGTDPSAPAERPGQLNWKILLGASVKVAIPAGILCALPLISAGSLLWVVGAATAIIVLYRRKRPMSVLNARSGFRIGVVAGLMIAYVSIAVTAALRVIQRFPMRLGSAIDEDYGQMIRQATTAFQVSAETQAQTLPYFHFMLTPDGRAAWSLMNMATVTILTVLLAAIGGAVGARMFSIRRTA